MARFKRFTSKGGEGKEYKGEKKWEEEREGAVRRGNREGKVEERSRVGREEEGEEGKGYREESS